MKQGEREARNENITMLTAEEAKVFGMEAQIQSFTANDFTIDASGHYSAFSAIDREVYPSHHISEVMAQRSDGARYIYGIPAYNNTHESPPSH